MGSLHEKDAPVSPQRIAIFVDGSNLFGSLSDMRVQVDRYDDFFAFVLERAIAEWGRQSRLSSPVPTQLLRVYWYEVGSIDEWDLTDAKAQATLRDVFDRNRDLNARYMADAGQALANRPESERSQDAIRREAWSRCFNDMQTWYEAKLATLNGMRRFHHAVRRDTDFIDVLEVGHWKVDFFTRTVSEKGLDASLAVDMVRLCSQFDIALVISGDADMLPSIRHCKAEGKHVGMVEFLKGYPPEDRGRGFSSRLRLEADFVAQIYEMDLVSKKIGRKAEPASPQGATS